MFWAWKKSACCVETGTDVLGVVMLKMQGAKGLPWLLNCELAWTSPSGVNLTGTTLYVSGPSHIHCPLVPGPPLPHPSCHHHPGHGRLTA
jgi:hypothetical protein